MREHRFPRMLCRSWDWLWFKPAAPAGLIIVRSILALQGLWLLLSRPDLPNLASWPPEMFTGVPEGFRLRFLVIFPESVERVFHTLAILLLVAILIGSRRRVLYFSSAVLLYHFSAFEELVAASPHMYFGGFTLPVLGFFILSFTRSPRAVDPPSFEWRWPLVMMHLLLMMNYFAAGIAKLGYSGWEWFTGDNIRNWMLARSTLTVAPAASYIAERPLFCWTFAIMTAVIELGAPLFILTPWLRVIFVALAFVGHLGIYVSMGIFFPSILLLAILLPWEKLPLFRLFPGAADAAEEISARATASVSRTRAGE